MINMLKSIDSAIYSVIVSTPFSLNGHLVYTAIIDIAGFFEKNESWKGARTATFFALFACKLIVSTRLSLNGYLVYTASLT